MISGKERASEGKGFRATAYAAFMIGLLDFCSDSTVNLPHPGIVVLDSPLVTYKRRDTTPGEEISEDVTAAFYKALAKLPAGKQVIVLENNDPPATLLIDFQWGGLRDVGSQLRSEFCHVVGGERGVVAGAGDRDIAKTRVEQVWVDTGVGVNEKH